MYTDLQITNLGLGKISSSRIQRLDPATSPLEVYMHNGYTPWKRAELTKRRWVFALEDDVVLSLKDTIAGVARPYKYELPTRCLRPVRQKRTEWVQRGRFVYSADPALKIQQINNVPEADFDALFVDVLACWIAVQSCEYVTQSNTKKDDVKAMYGEAVAVAGKMNAFIIGPEDVTADDNDFDFVNARYV